MKKYLVFILSLTSVSIAASQSPGPITYTEVVAMDGLTQSQLFVNARQWYNKTFVSSKHVLQIADKESGELSGKGIMKLQFRANFNGFKKQEAESDFSVDIAVKDGKYKYTFSDFRIYPTAYRNQPFVLLNDETCPVKYGFIRQSVMNSYYQASKEATASRVKELAASLKTSMENKTASDF